MTHVPYVGSGPYCYANAFAMLLGEHAPSTAVIETVTGSPFGMQLIGGTRPYFDPYGWKPEAGFDDALAALGWTSSVVHGSDADEAPARLRDALEDGPAFVGPVELGLLRHQPGAAGAVGADHYVVVLAIDDQQVLMHDPQGYPYATLPLDDFVAAWRGDALEYGTPFTLRTRFTRVADVTEADAVRASLPTAIDWLSGGRAHAMPPGSLANGDAAEALAALFDEGDGAPLLREDLINFAVRVGARRAGDAATCLTLAGLPEAARIASEQARLIGSLQHPLVTDVHGATAAALRELAPTYDLMLTALRRTTPRSTVRGRI